MVTFLESLLATSNHILWSYIIIALLIILGLYFTIRSGFAQFKLLGDMFRLLGKDAIKEREKGSVSTFQAFCISTATRVGTGNLAGVAIAIAMGGPGAVFWMWIIALIGAGTSIVECTLAQIYKVKDDYGYRGGPAYFMENALKQRWLGVLFSILMTITFGIVFTSVQVNTISLAFEEAFNISRLLTGIILTIVTILIIFGGLKRIARVTEVMVPVMAIFYLVIAFYVILTNITYIPAVFAIIFKSAFGMNQAVGGTIGGALMWGIKRGLFSNEAGMGSAPNAAATSNVTHPIKPGEFLF
jgi:AGCS family alanine or glycine:cation symporter